MAVIYDCFFILNSYFYEINGAEYPFPYLNYYFTFTLIASTQKQAG